MPELIGPSKYHRTLNGAELLKAREDMGLSQAQEHEVSIDITNKISNVIGKRIQ